MGFWASGSDINSNAEARQARGDSVQFAAQPGGFVPVDPSGRQIVRTEYKAHNDTYEVTYSDGSKSVHDPAGYDKIASGMRAAAQRYDDQMASQIGAPDIGDQAQAEGLQSSLIQGLQSGVIPRRTAIQAAENQVYLPTRGLSSSLGSALADQQRADAMLAAGRAGDAGALESQRLAAAGVADQRAQGQTLGAALLQRAQSNQGALTALATGRRQSAIADTERSTRRLGAALQAAGELGMGAVGMMGDDDEQQTAARTGRQ
jgi:hypothetical protein